MPAGRCELPNPNYNIDSKYPIVAPKLVHFTRGRGPVGRLAAHAGLSYNTLNRSLNKNVFSPQIARRLEFATGINRLKWMYPDEYGSAWEDWENNKYATRSLKGVEFLMKLRVITE